MMQATPDSFLMDLRTECLSDPDDNFGLLRAALADFSKTPYESIGEFLKCCHTLKGNLQAVGLNQCAKFLHEFESALSRVEETLKSGGTVSATTLENSEVALSEAVHSLEDYFAKLRGGAADSEELLLSHMTALQAIQIGAPVAVVAAVPEAVEKKAESKSPLDAVVPVKSNVVNLPLSSVEETTDQYLLVRHQNRVFAIPVGQVFEIIQVQPLNALPFPRRDMVGILNFRGDPLPILRCEDFETDQNSANHEDEAARFIVIARLEEKTFGFQIEQALNVTTLNPVDFEKPETLVALGERSWVKYFAKAEQETILVLDLRRALAA